MQLDVRGCASVQASFERFCEVERMEGRDQYQTEVHGLQVRGPSTHRVPSLRSKPSIGFPIFMTAPEKAAFLESASRMHAPSTCPKICFLC